MKEIINKVTDFVNENTMLLIGICAFLILVLIVYLIDNSIKTKKMQKAIKEMDAVEDKVIESNIDNTNTVVENNNEPKFDSISLVDEDKELDTYEKTSNVETPVVDNEPEITISTEVPEKEEINPVPTPNVENKFTNKKSLSEILAKKKESININDTDKTLEETTEFNNTF